MKGIFKEIITNRHTLYNAVLALVLVFSVSISGVYAFLIARYQKINPFTIGDISIQLLTNFDSNNNGTFDSGETAKHIASLSGPSNLAAGSVFMMQPYVKNTGSADTYVYIEIGVPKTDAPVATSNGISNTSELFSINNANTGNGSTQWTLVSSDTSDADYNYYLYAYNTALGTNSDTSYLFNALATANFVTGAKISTKLSYYAPETEAGLNNVADIANDEPEDYTDKYLGVDDGGYANGWENILNDDTNVVHGIDINAAAGVITEVEFDHDLSIDDIASFIYNGQEYSSKDLYAYHFSATYPRSLDMSGSGNEEVIFYSITPPLTISDMETINLPFFNFDHPINVEDIPEYSGVLNTILLTLNPNTRIFSLTNSTSMVKTYYVKYGASWIEFDESYLESMTDPDQFSFTIGDGEDYFPCGNDAVRNKINGEVGIRTYWNENYEDINIDKYVFVSDANGKNVRMLCQYDDNGHLDTSSITGITFNAKNKYYINSQGNIVINDDYQPTQNDTPVIKNGVVRETYGTPDPSSAQIKIKAYAIQPDAYTSSPVTSWVAAANSNTSIIDPEGNYTYS